MAYYGITHPDMPNSFWLLGPGTGLGKYDKPVLVVQIWRSRATVAGAGFFVGREGRIRNSLNPSP